MVIVVGNDTRLAGFDVVSDQLFLTGGQQRSGDLCILLIVEAGQPRREAFDGCFEFWI
jgi:hypothetical protein